MAPGGRMSAGGLALGLALAGTGSLALNAGYVGQHLAAVREPPVSLARPLASMGGLLRSPLWLAGTAAGLAGWLMHVGALSWVPLSLAQAFSAGGLAIAVLIAARVTGRRLGRPGRSGVVLMLAALVVLALGARGGAAARAFAGLPVAGFAGAIALAVVAVLLRRRGPYALGAAAGAIYGVGDVATKAITEVAHAGLAAAVLSPWAALLACTSITGFFCFQRALQLGNVVGVISLMTAGNSVIAVLGGLVAFGEPLGTSTVGAGLRAAALAAVVVAGWWLAPAQAGLMNGTGDARSYPAA
jgi:drug/metabolite transporter (DMT)-like permease